MKRFVVVVLSLAFLVACSSDDTSSTPEPQVSAPQRTPIAGIDAVVRGTEAVTGSMVDIEVDDNYFEPNVLTASPGAKLTLKIESEGETLHNFSVTEQKVDHDITPGSSATIDVTLPASGSLVFFCKYHRDESGMVGVFNVT